MKTIITTEHRRPRWNALSSGSLRWLVFAEADYGCDIEDLFVLLFFIKNVFPYILTLFVDGRNGPDAVVAERAENFGDCLVVGAQTADGVVQFLRVKLRKRRHQSDNGILEVPTEFAL